MLFEKFRRRSKYSRKDPKPEISCITSSNPQASHTQPKVTTLPTTSTLVSPDNANENRDFAVFLEKTKRDEEREERDRLKAIVEAEKRKKEFNMSPWGGRM